MRNNFGQIKDDIGNVRFSVGDHFQDIIKITEMSLEDVSVPPSGGMGEGKLLIQTQRLRTQEGTTTPRAISILMQLTADANGTITECFADMENAIETAKQESCQTIGGVYKSEENVCDLSSFPQPPQDDLAVSTNYLDEHSDELTKEIYDEIDDNYVHIEGDTMTGDLFVDADIESSGTLNAQEVQTSQVRADEQLCIGPNCRTTFEDQQCNLGQVIRKVNSDGTIECANVTCPNDAEFYVGIDSNGDVLCKPFPTETCPADHYVTKVHDDGSVDCQEVSEPNKISNQSCSTGEFVSGIDSKKFTKNNCFEINN